MKRKLNILALALLCVLCGCSKSYKDIKLTSFEIISIMPRGLDAVDAVVDVGLDNPIMGFEVFNALGTIKINGQECLSVVADQLVVEGHSEKVYRVPLHGTLAPGFNPLGLLSLVKDMDMSQVTVDAKARVGLRGGIGKEIDMKDIKLDKLLKKSKGNILE